jgi:hypothetical protein
MRSAPCPPAPESGEGVECVKSWIGAFISSNITAVQHTLVTQRTHLGAKFNSEYCKTVAHVLVVDNPKRFSGSLNYHLRD